MTRVATPLSLRAYQFATGLAELFAPLMLNARARRGKEDTARLGERLGRAGAPRPDGHLAWLHGASIGEALSLMSLIDALRAARPDLNILVTSGTRTSAQLMARRLPDGVIHQYIPIDGPRAVASFLDYWRPDLGVFVEGELWPNLLLAAQARGVRLALVSAKLSVASYQRWKRQRRAAQRLYGVFALILAQNETAAAFLKELGVATDGLGDLKFGHPALAVDTSALAARESEVGGRPVILAASTHPGEDEQILAGFAIVAHDGAKPLLVIAPRHPERGPDILTAASAAGFSASLESVGGTLDQAQVFIADRLGEMGLWLRLAHLAIMGGSLVRGIGGHNPLEPARLGTPVASGVHVDNWASAYEAFDKDDAVDWVGTKAALEEAMMRVLVDRKGLADMAARALVLVQARDLAARAAPARVVELAP